MTLYQIVLAMKARWRAVAFVFGSVLALGILATILSPKQYTASGSVVVDVKSADPIANAVLPALAISSYMATQSDVIKSERVIARALRDLHLDRDPELVAKWKNETDGEGDMLAWQTEQVLKKFEVLPSRESNVITVEYRGLSREGAAGMVNAVIKAYLATLIELRNEPAVQYDSFFDERAKRARETLEQAQNKLSAFQQQAGVSATDEKLDAENTRLTELSTQLVAAQALAGESSSRKALSRTNAEHTPEVLASPLISGRMSELVRQESRLNELRTSHGEQAPDVQQAVANISQLRRRIASETRKVTDSLEVSNTVNNRSVEQMRAALDEQRAKVLKLKSLRDQASVLQKDVDNASQAFARVTERVNQAGMESKANQTNVSVLKMASLPGLPSRPRTLVNIAVSIFFGLLLSAAVVIVRELRDQRLRIDEDVPLQLGHMLFGVLPDHRPPKRLGLLRGLPLLGNERGNHMRSLPT